MEPLPDTVATLVLLDVHVNVVATPSGSTVAVISAVGSVFSRSREILAGLSVTLLGTCVIITEHVALNPLDVVALIVAVPAPTTVTRPL